MSKPGGMRRFIAPIIAPIAIVAAMLLFTPFGERPLAMLFPVGDVAAIDFATLALSDKPNQHLVCPPGFCGAAAHGESPIFDLSVAELRSHWNAVIAAQPRVTTLSDGDGQVDYVQRTAMVRYPDIITVRFIALAPNQSTKAQSTKSQSTLALYSRSIFGTSDFGVNKARIDAWLAALDTDTKER